MRALCRRSKSRPATPVVSICFCFPSLIATTFPAAAFRPFDGTDAAVADPGKLEIELQPAGRLQDESGTALIARATRLNFGLKEGWEPIVEGLLAPPLSPAGPSSVSAAGMSLKAVVRLSVPQNKIGPSIATEFGMLLPDSIGNSGLAPAGRISCRSVGIGERCI